MQDKFKEIERKWLIKCFPGGFPQVAEGTLEQAYISTKPEVRVRKCDMKGESLSHWITIKSDGSMVRDEVNIRINKDQYKALLASCGKDPIIKEFHKYELPGNLFLECSLVDDGKRGSFMYAEIEFPDEDTANAFEPLDFFGKEVTNDPAYKMKNYWKATRNLPEDDTNKELEPMDDCENCNYKDECQNLNKALDELGPFGDFLRRMQETGRILIEFDDLTKKKIHDPEKDNSEDCEGCEDKADNSEDAYSDDVLNFIAQHVACIHNHLDDLPFNNAQMSQLSRMIRSIINDRTISSEWMGECEMKTGKIKGVLTKKKAKKLIKKELRKFLKSKKFRKEVKSIVKGEAWALRSSSKADILNLRKVFSEELDRVEHSIYPNIIKAIEDRSCACHGEREAVDCDCTEKAQDPVDPGINA